MSGEQDFFSITHYTRRAARFISLSLPSSPLSTLPHEQDFDFEGPIYIYTHATSLPFNFSKEREGWYKKATLSLIAICHSHPNMHER